MILNKKTEYALSIVIYVARVTKTERLVSTSQIYDSTLIPKKFSTVILSELQRAGILKSVRGSNGGYTLNKGLRDITIFDILRATTQLADKKADITDNLYQDFAVRIDGELEDEFYKILSSMNMETLLKRFETMSSPMTPMFYI